MTQQISYGPHGPHGQIKNQLEFVRHQLKEEFSVDQTTSGIWRAIVNDSGRDWDVASSMVVCLADDRRALASFADTFREYRTNQVVEIKTTKVTNWKERLAFVVWGVVLGVIGGWLVFA